MLQAIELENESRKEWMLDRFSWRAKQDKRISKFKFWKPDNHAVYMDPLTPDIITQKIDYVHVNPIVAGIVGEAHHYVYSSAIDYAGGKGLVKVSIA